MTLLLSINRRGWLCMVSRLILSEAFLPSRFGCLQYACVALNEEPQSPPSWLVGGPGMRKDLSAHLHLWQYEKSESPHLAHRLDKYTHYLKWIPQHVVEFILDHVLHPFPPPNTHRATSGVLLLTRHTDAARKIAALFQEHRIIKKYLYVNNCLPLQLTIP